MNYNNINEYTHLFKLCLAMAYTEIIQRKYFDSSLHISNRVSVSLKY